MIEGIKSWTSSFEQLLPGKISGSQSDERQVLRLDENSFAYVCRLWDGVFLWGNDVHSPHIPYPDYGPNQGNYAVLNICHSGRCEVEMRDDAYIYMTPGLLNINNRTPKEGYIYPGSDYEGMEIAFDLNVLREKTPEALSDFGLSGEVLKEYLIRGDGNYMATVSDSAMQRSKSLFEHIRNGDLRIEDYRFLTLSLLYHMKNGEAVWLKNQSHVTKGQRRIAVEVEGLLTEDFRKHYSVENLSSRYGISPSALKKYFEAVFGSPISYYLRNKRMDKAKELLVSTEVSIGQVASICGYENQGKFGSAFKTNTGVSPLEYRRLYKKPQEGECYDC